MATRYGWIIDTDTTADTSKPQATNSNAVGLMGPRSILPQFVDSLKEGKGRKFRMLDDDATVIYTGRIVTLSTDDEGSEVDFSPLDDFGEGNAGCTRIDYKVARKWVTL